MPFLPTALSQQGKTPGREILDAALRSCSTHLNAARVFSGLIALLYLAPSIYMLQVYDRVLSTGGVMTLLFISGLLIVALITHSQLDSARQRLLARAALRMDRVLGARIIRHGFDDGRARDARSAQILREWDTFRQSMQGPIAIAFLDLPYTPLYILVAFALHFWLGMLVLGGAALLIAIAVAGERATKLDLATAAQNAPAAYAAAEMNQAFGGAVRALGMRGVMARRLGGERDRQGAQSTRSGFVAMRYSGAIRLLRMVLQSASLGLGAYLAIQQQISPGSLIAASILAGRALAPIDQIVGSWRQLSQARDARLALVSFLDDSVEQSARMDLPAPAGALVVENASVAIGLEARPVLHNISFALAPGEALGIVGASGAGKSTLARILVGGAEPQAGSVRLDGSSIANWDSDSLGAHIGYLPQETALFGGTIAENISRFTDDAGAGPRIISAAQSADIHTMVQRLPKGYDTMLGPRGAGLSAGQSQRLALARALYGDPKILVLDEPNSHLDSEGDASLLATLSAAKARGATIVIMTHRSGILAVTDKLLVLQDGRVEHFGPRDVVLQALRKAAVQSGQVRSVAGGQGQPS